MFSLCLAFDKTFDLIPPPVGDVTELMFIFYVLASSSVTDIL
jgi:hypothetical protein